MSTFITSSYKRAAKLLLPLLLFCVAATAQYTPLPRYLSNRTEIGYIQGIARIDSGLIIPADTIVRATWPQNVPYVARKNGAMYVWDYTATPKHFIRFGDTDSSVFETIFRSGRLYYSSISATPTGFTLNRDNGTRDSVDVLFPSATVTLGGDISGTGLTGTTITTTLPNINSNVGSFTNANLTVNAKGQVTAVANGAAGTITGGVINWPAIIFTSPTTATTPSGILTFTPALANQSAWNVLGNHTSGSAAPTFGLLNVHSISATGSVYDGTKFLADNGTWAIPSVDLTPYVTLGTVQTIIGKKTFTSTISAASGSASGTVFSPNLTATANFDELIGVYVNPFYTVGSFTNVSLIDIETPTRIKSGAFNSSGYDFKASALNNISISPSGVALGATGQFNIAFGRNTMGALTSGTQNVAIGENDMNAISSGVGNTAVGVNSLSGVISSNYNVGVGNFAGQSISGSYNIAIGSTAASTLTSGGQNIVIGFGNEVPSPTGSGQISIGNLIWGTGATATGHNLSVGKIGIGIDAPNSTLQVAGSFSSPFVAKTASYTLTDIDEIIEADATSGAITETLPTAVGIAGREYEVVKTDASANAVTIATTSSQNIISTAGSATTFSLSAQGKYVRVKSNNVKWIVIANN